MDYFGYNIMILEIIAIIIIFIAIFLFLFLLVGLKVNINLNKENSDFKGQIDIKWAFIKIFSKNFPENDKDNEDETEDEADEIEDEKVNKKNESLKNQFNDFKDMLPLIKKNFDDIFELLLVCINSIKLEKFNSHISLGFSSPVGTVNVVGSIWAFQAVSNLSENFYLSVVPVFTHETIDFHSEIVFKISLLRPAGKLSRLLTKKSMIELIWKSRKLFNNV